MPTVKDFMKVLPSKEVRNSSPILDSEADERGESWHDILLSINDNILLIDEQEIAKEKGFVGAREFASILSYSSDKMPLLVHRANKDEHEQEMPLLKWVNTICSYKTSDENPTLVNMTMIKVLENYINVIKEDLKKRKSEKIITSHFSSLLEFPSNIQAGGDLSVPVSEVLISLVIELVMEFLDCIIAHYPEALYITVLFLNNSSTKGNEDQCEFSHNVILKFNEVAESNPELLRVRISNVKHYAPINAYSRNVMMRPCPVIPAIDSAQNAELVNLVYPLVRMIMRYSLAKSKVIITENSVMDMVSPSCWLECIVEPLISGDEEELTYPVSIIAKQEDEICIKRTIRAASTLNESDKLKAFRKIIKTVQSRLYERGVSQKEWEELFASLKIASSGILVYKPELRDVFNVNAKNQKTLLPIMRADNIKPLFEICAGDMSKLVSSYKATATLHESLTEEYLHFLEYNVSDGGATLKGEDRIVKYLETLLSLKQHVRKGMVGAFKQAMENEGIHSTPWRRVVKHIRKITDASFMVEMLGVPPYDLMEVSEVDAVKSYCMRIMF